MRMLGKITKFGCPHCAAEQKYAEQCAPKRKGKQRRKKRIRAQEKRTWRKTQT